MASNDPTETGGLFIGRRPGTAPLRYREQPVEAGPCAGAWTRSSRPAILVVETLLLTTLWGPQPAGWLWIGAQVYHATGLGRPRASWSRSSGCCDDPRHDRDRDAARPHVEARAPRERPRAEKGALERIFVISMAIAGIAFAVWFLVIQGPGPDLAPRAG